MCNILGNHLRLELLHTSLPLIPGLHQGLGTPASRLAWRNWSRGPNLAPGHPQALAKIDALAWHHFEPCQAASKPNIYTIFKKNQGFEYSCPTSQTGQGPPLDGCRWGGGPTTNQLEPWP